MDISETVFSLSSCQHRAESPLSPRPLLRPQSNSKQLKTTLDNADRQVQFTLQLGKYKFAGDSCRLIAPELGLRYVLCIYEIENILKKHNTQSKGIGK